MAVCDWCNASDPHWTYPCRSFAFGAMARTDVGKSIIEQSTGDWAACNDCSILIERCDWQALIDRVLVRDRLPSKVDPGFIAAMRLRLLNMYTGFHANRTGPRHDQQPTPDQQFEIDRVNAYLERRNSQIVDDFLKP